MVLTRTAPLFVLAAIAEIGGCWLIWQAVRESRPWWLAIAGALSLVAYGFVAAAQPDSHFGRVLAAYGGVFVAGSLIWGIAFDGFRPTRYDVLGAVVCLGGVAIIMLAPKH
jgi:small multidrug resistance family-3 protein